MADERRTDSLFSMSEFVKQPPPAHAHTSIPTISTPPPSQMTSIGRNLTPPPAHLRGLGHTPPPPHIQVHTANNSGTIHTPPPAHMNDHRSSPGLQLLGHVAASPQLKIHSTPSPHLSAHSGGSPAHHNLLNLDRPSSRESYSMTPPRAQVFPHAGVQPELMKVLRPGLPIPSLTTNTLTLPNGPHYLSGSAMSLTNSVNLQQHLQQQNSLAHYIQSMQQQANEQALLMNAISTQQQQNIAASQYQESQIKKAQQHHQSKLNHSPIQELSQHSPNSLKGLSAMPPTNFSQQNVIGSNLPSSSLFQPYGNIAPPEPSPHQELKMLAKIASSELGKINSSPQKTLEPNNNLSHDEKVYSQRIHNLNNFPSSTPYASSYRSRSIAMQRARATCITSSAKSLDILRSVIQARVNEELKAIVDQYVDRYFRPALGNIRDNNGQSSVSEEHIQCICRKILEEASRMYMGPGLRSRSATPDGYPDNMSDIGSVASDKRTGKLPFSRLKRKPQSDSESETGSHRKKKRGRPPGSLGVSSLAIKKEGPRWNPDRLNSDSYFIMGSKANKALGLGNTRGRIYFKHPDIFKYTGDSEDKLWLYENQKMPGTGGKVYMMILEDIQMLSKSPEYRDSLDMSCLKGFKIPEWMVEKAKKQMRSMRTDGDGNVKPKLKTLTNVINQETYDADSDKNVPFTSAASSRKSLSDSKIGSHSPANTEEMELLSSEEQEDPPVSPFGSAEDYAPVSPGNSGSSLKPESPGAALGLGLPHDNFTMT